ncbi:hypothetical protein LSTR_LSTR002596 [Laodelphax striatellus]|uniref:Uncharacterized protein n=1 Tax=Laodelphax striatellus TaxID=195883 RepID=A0A482XLN6_LAOST|nr:hypothetical protein LSTR_LSTR002596 [Laodelphax striatellus]
MVLLSKFVRATLYRTEQTFASAAAPASAILSSFFVEVIEKTLRNGSSKYLVFSSPEIWTRISFLPCLRQRTWSDQEIQFEPLPSVLQGIRV